MNAQPPFCRGCGQLIWDGAYLEALGAFWHPEHFVCAGCGRPINSSGSRFLLHNGAPYHETCYTQQVAAHCAYCGRPLIGKYLVDHWGTKFCQEHVTQYPSCAYCGRLVPPGQQTQTPGGLCCPICRASAVETIEEARPLYEQVKRWLNQQGLVYNNLRLSLELCDQRRLAMLLAEQGPTHSQGATTSATYVQDGRVVRTEINGIAVLQALPATLFQGVTAHELGHVWLIVHSVDQLPLWAEEGFCELLSYRYYQELHTPESLYHAQAIEQNADPMYGEGFRRVKALSDVHGFARLLTILRTTKRLPG